VVTPLVVVFAGLDESERRGGRTFIRLRPTRSYTTLWDVTAGGRRSDVQALRAGAAALRASKRPVDLYVAVLSGQRRTRPLNQDPNVIVLGSDEFWQRMSGISDFRARLIRATVLLSGLIITRAATEVLRIRTQAHAVFGDASGNLDLAKLADPPARPRQRRRTP
jgi:hypothetical protein